MIKKWAEEYPNLRCKNQLGSYHAKNKNWWQSLDLESYEAVFGGETAALSYVDGVKPRSGIVYVGKHKQGSLIRDLKLVRVQDSDNKRAGNIEIRSKFWGQVEDHSLLSNSTHPLITYADLMDKLDPTSRALAAKIAEQYFSDEVL